MSVSKRFRRAGQDPAPGAIGNWRLGSDIGARPARARHARARPARARHARARPARARPGGARPGRPADRGGVTVEAALALAVLAVVLVSCLAGIACLIAQIRCADAAREAARLAGRGDAGLAAAAVATLAPDGAALSLGGDGDLVTAVVTARAVGGLLPGVTITASAAAAREPAR